MFPMEPNSEFLDNLAIPSTEVTHHSCNPPPISGAMLETAMQAKVLNHKHSDAAQNSHSQQEPNGPLGSSGTFEKVKNDSKIITSG